MVCPQCGSPNPDAALQCADCGAALSSTSFATDEADARRELAAAQEAVRRLRRYVPAIVAEGVLRDQERLRGERREVAVLFADAVDFTRLSASLDAEAVFGLINDLLGRLVECVHRYDGLVDKFAGDGLMAVFGAPAAHENDSELAIRAALDMQRAADEFESVARARLGAPLQIRIGIHAGPVIAGIIGTQEQAAYTVIGETVNLAARLESQARPGCVLVSSRIYEQTHALFNFQALGTTQIKGIDLPVDVYEAVGDRSRPLPKRGLVGVTTIFLGRDAELEQLCVLGDAFLEDRHGRLVVVQGEAGMGKSRLVSEWLATVPTDQVAVWQGRALPYSQGVGYTVFRSLLQNALSDQPSPAWDSQVSPALRLFLWRMVEPVPPEEQAALRYLEPEHVKRLTVLALREWVLGEARTRPIILLLEDFHWADDLSRDIVQALTNLIYEAPVLMCIVARPQPEAPLDLAVPQAAKKTLAAPLYLPIKLQPLLPEHSRALLAHMVNLDSLPERLVHTILTRAEGNPFYIEEFVRMLIEKGALTIGDGQCRVSSTVALDTLDIPTSLRGLMMARVDRLPEELQEVLRTASVIGLQFPARLLEAVESRLHGPVAITPLLERLKDLGLLERRSQDGEPVYAFRHIITQETIYRGLLYSQRPRLHYAVAECVESLYAADLSSQVEVLALHYDRARVRDKALHYALLAGDRAHGRFANREAIECYSRVLQLSQHLDGYEAERWHAATRLGEVEQRIGEYEEAAACYQAALDDWSEAAPEERAQVMLHLGQVWDKRGDLQEAEGWLHGGLAQLGGASMAFPELGASLCSELGWISLRRGDLTTSQEWLEQGLALVQGSDHYEVLSFILNRLSAVYHNRGELDQAIGYAERALGFHEQLKDLVGYARSLNNLGMLRELCGDWDSALADYERSIELHERIDDMNGLVLACTNAGVLYTERGEWNKAEEKLQQSVAIAERTTQSYELARAHMNLGRLYLLQERWRDGARHLNTAIPWYKEAGAIANLSLSSTYELLGRLHLEQGQLDAARDWAGNCYELLQKVTGASEGNSIEWGRYEQLMGRIALARGNRAAARRHLDRSASIFRAAGSQIEAGRTAYWSGLLWLKEGQPENAREELLMARQVFERLGAAADLRRVEEQLAQIK